MNQYPWLSYNEECEVLVIGGGVMGCTALYKLSKENIDAVLITQKPVGFCDSKHLICQPGNELMITELIKKYGKIFSINYFKRCQEALLEIKEICNNKVYCKFRDSFVYDKNFQKIHNEYLMRRHNGIVCDYLENTSEVFSFNAKGGILQKDGACEIDYYEFCHLLAYKSEELGARIFENTTAIRIEEYGEKYIVKTSYGKNIIASKIVLCLGKESAEYLDDIAQIKESFTLITNPVKQFDGYLSRAVIKNEDIVLHTTDDDRIVISGLSISTLGNRLSKMIGKEKIDNRKFDELNQKLSEMLVGIENINIDVKLKNEYLSSNDILPIFQKLNKNQNIYLATVCSENAIAYAMVTADKICNLFSNSKSKVKGEQ
ncbi:MAG: FAD-dependent oxidoreductase [Oscillospiraceae bacterium]